MMSEQEEITISQAVERCLSNALGSQGSMITGFLGVVTYMNEEGDQYWSFLRSEHATAIGDLGMARVITKTVEGTVDHLMYASGDE
jgi:hypothetical protein